MNEQITIQHIQALNLYLYSGNKSERIRAQGFMPAFYNSDSLTAEVSRFTDGQVAPIHLLDGLPNEWVAARNASGKIVALKGSVEAGYLYEGVFYTAEQVTETLY